MKSHLKTKITTALIAATAMIALLCLFATVSMAADTPSCDHDGCSGVYENGFCSADATHLEPAFYNETSGYYEIGNAGQLYWFASQVANANATYRNANAVLTADITVNPQTLTGITEGVRAWTPIGSNRENCYSGHFDGQGHTVSGLYHYSVKESQYMGLFGYLQDATVENLAVTNFYFQADHSYIGGVVGMMYESTVRNCYVQGSIFGRDTLSYVGGIVGASGKYDNLIESCLVNASLRVSTDESEFTITLISGPYNYIGALTTTGGGEIKNSFYVTDAYSGEPTSPSNYTLTNVSGKAMSAMTDGTVAAALGAAWGQNYDNGAQTQPLPVLGGAVVYYGYTDCAYTGDPYYSNTPLNPTKGHKQTNAAQGHEIVNLCAYCGQNEQGRLTLKAPENTVFGEGVTHTASYTCTLPSCTVSHPISYCCPEGCTMPGTHTASVTLDGQTATLSFEIANNTVFPEDVTVEITTEQQYIYYKGESGARPTVRVTRGGTELTLGTDYSVYYTDNTKVTTEAHATVVLHIQGYNGAAKTIDFEIVPFKLTHVLYSNSTGKFSVPYGEPMWETLPLQLYPTYEGNVSFKFDEQYIMVEGVDFVTDMTPERYASLKNGSHSITVTGIGNFTGTRTLTVEITRADLSVADRFEYEIDPGPYVYTGDFLDPIVQIYDKVKGTYLTLGTDFYLNGRYTYPGQHSISFAGSGNYFGSSGEVGTFTILPFVAKPEAAVDSITLEYVPGMNVSWQIERQLSPALTLPGDASHSSFTYEYRAVGDTEFTTGLPTASGEYEVRILINSYGFPNSGNGYELVPSDIVPVSVKKASLTVTVLDQYLEGDDTVDTYPSLGYTYEYEFSTEAENVTVDVDLFANGHDIDATVAVIYTQNGSPSDVTGNYDITVVKGLAHTFSQNWTAGVASHSRTCSYEGCGFEQTAAHDNHIFTENPEELSISATCGSCGADAGKLILHVPQNAVYNGNPHLSSYEGQILGLSEDQIHLLDNQPVNHTAASTTTLAVGSASVSGTFSIGRAPITITLLPTEIEQFSALPTVYEFSCEGLAEGDRIESVTVQVSSNAALTPGEYVIKIYSVQFAEGTESNNYTYTSVSSTLTVTEHTNHREFDEDGICSICNAGYEQPESDQDGTYLISKLGHMFWLAQEVNGGNTAINAKLTCEIDLNPGYIFTPDSEGTLSVILNGESTTDLSGLRSWTPIQGFAGTFDGAGFALRGIYYHAGYNNIALFASTEQSAKIKNLEIHNSYINANGNVAAIVANHAGLIENCYSSATVVANNEAGGIASVSTGTIKQCIHAGRIISQGSVGGVVASLQGGSVTQSANRGSVIGNIMVGGVVGQASAQTEISRCYNTGSVVSNGEVAWYMGGIVGKTQGDVTNCYNSGSVEANTQNHAGGIAGYSADGTISNCFNTGLVIANQGNVGAIEGFGGSGVKQNNYYLTGTAPGGINSEDTKGAAEALTEQQFEGGLAAYLLNQGQETAVWGQEIGKDQIPVYDGMTVYIYYDCNGTTVLATNTENTPDIQHADENCDHVCDKETCGAEGVGEHVDQNLDHACDYGCTQSIGLCRDVDPIDHKCDHGCGADFGEHADLTGDHSCDYGCSESIGTCEDVDPIDHRCDHGCGKYFGTCEDTDFDHACDWGCTHTYGTHRDITGDHVCEYGCSKPIGTCEDQDHDHACDYGNNCTVVFGVCEDVDPIDHACDYGCSQAHGSHTDNDYDHICDHGCAESIGTCEDANKDHLCDYGCSVTFGEHTDTNKDHACDWGCADSIGTCEDADPIDHKCDHGCSKTFGEHVDTNGDTVCDHGCAEALCSCPDQDRDHACDNGCTEAVGAHEDSNKDHACDWGCSESIGEHADADNDHHCDWGCSEKIGACIDDNFDHACDKGCSAPIGVHEDLDRDHACDYGCLERIEAHEQATGTHACAWCGEVMSECADSNGDNHCDTCYQNICEHVPANDGNWSVTDTHHWKQCKLCLDFLEPQQEHSDQNNDHACDVCTYSVSYCSDSDDHLCDLCGKKISACSDPNSDHFCDLCGEQINDCCDYDYNHVCDLCGKQTECADNNSDHLCDYCDKELGTCEDADSDHVCDLCNTNLTQCSDENNDHLCDTCADELSTCYDSNNDHDCDVCSKTLDDHADGNKDHRCDKCSIELSTCEDADSDHVCDLCNNTLTDCTDANADHLCDACGKVLTDCTDTDSDHACDLCGEELTTCGDHDSDHLCDVCGAVLTACEDENSDHLCDVCQVELSACADADGNHTCDICQALLSAHDDRNNDHMCDLCGVTFSDHIWTQATCTSPALCEICGAEDGEPSGHIAGQWQVITPPTTESEGLEQLHCSICKELLEEKVLPVLEQTDTEPETTEPAETTPEPETTEPAETTPEPETTEPAEQTPGEQTTTQQTEQSGEQSGSSCFGILPLGAVLPLLSICGIGLVILGKKRKD